MNQDAGASSDNCRPDSEETCSPECCRATPSALLSDHATGGQRRWQIGSLQTTAGAVPVISTTLVLADHLGSWKARQRVAHHLVTEQT